MDNLRPSHITFSRLGADAPYTATLALGSRFVAIDVIMDKRQDGAFLNTIQIGTYIPAIARGCGRQGDQDCACASLHAALTANSVDASPSFASLISHGCPVFQAVLQSEVPQVYIVECAAGTDPLRRLHEFPMALNVVFQAILSEGKPGFGTGIVRALVETFFNPTVRILFSTNGTLDASLRMPVDMAMKFKTVAQAGRALH